MESELDLVVSQMETIGLEDSADALVYLQLSLHDLQKLLFVLVAAQWPQNIVSFAMP